MLPRGLSAIPIATELTVLSRGFEQANKYVIMDAQGNHIGYMAEQERGLGNAMARQWFRTHRSFVMHVFDRHENEVLRVCSIFATRKRRPLSDAGSFTVPLRGSILESKSTIHWARRTARHHQPLCKPLHPALLCKPVSHPTHGCPRSASMRCA